MRTFWLLRREGQHFIFMGDDYEPVSEHDRFDPEIFPRSSFRNNRQQSLGTLLDKGSRASIFQRDGGGTSTALLKRLMEKATSRTPILSRSDDTRASQSINASHQSIKSSINGRVVGTSGSSAATDRLTNDRSSIIVNGGIVPGAFRQSPKLSSSMQMNLYQCYKAGESPRVPLLILQ